MFRDLTRKSHFHFVIVMLAMLVATGCAKKPKPDESLGATTENATANASGDSDSGNAMGLQTINFPFDSFALDKTGKEKMKANADIMKAHPSMKVQVEGHCDNRGGIQYNLALGEKRAGAVKAYLSDLGISADRVTTISFGKEKPIDPGSSDEAYARNRRANFVITSQ